MRDRWENISVELNSIPGAKKTGEQWKRAWKDLKMNVKKKNSNMKDYMKGTGGGPPAKNELDSVDEAVLNILGPTLVEGDTEVLESTATWSTIPIQDTPAAEETIYNIEIEGNDVINTIILSEDEADHIDTLKFVKEDIQTKKENLKKPAQKPKRPVQTKMNRLIQLQNNSNRLIVSLI
ncbi:hypothetical protein NQ315_013902 [Exocentrus adspersus]|uniref:Regulatory protein zeste n=1 Tax=Exocentrus adspersus TaxID=1586481 RepID=A0AAV8V6R2_9CUCU|nr:hypothetical protein NQ315_013902 [Exocentrus adspersus]